MLKPKIDQTVDKIVLHMNDDTIVGLARSIEKSYGPDTGQGVLHGRRQFRHHLSQWNRSFSESRPIRCCVPDRFRTF